MQKFWAKQPVFVVLLKAKGLYSSSKLTKRFEFNIYFKFYIPHNKIVFFDDINCHTEIIFDKWVVWMKSKIYWNS